MIAAQIDLLGRLGVHASQVRSAAQGMTALRDALAERRCLLIVDDVWSDAAARAFRAAGPRGRVLHTSRDPQVLRAVGARVERVDVLPDAAAASSWHSWPRPPATNCRRRSTASLAVQVALALALVGAAVGRGGRTWSELAEELERGSETFLDHQMTATPLNAEVFPHAR